MPRSTQHQRNLVTVTVGPGSETGLYYIVVANVCWGRFSVYHFVGA